MKVLRRNNYEHVFPMEVTCRQVVDENGFTNGNKADYCGSLLEVVAEDIKKHSWHKYPDYSGVDYGVICPVCGCFTAIDENTIPQTIKETCEEISLSRRR